MEKGILDLSDEISEKEKKLHYPQVRFITEEMLSILISQFG